jgi:hypothetical protein
MSGGNLPSREQSEALKLIAIVTMTVDHVGAVLLPNISWLRIIGRIAFPIFAYQIAVGYLHTHDLHRYIRRLLLWGIVSQPITMLAFRETEFNIMFTLALGLLAIWGWDKKKWRAVLLALVLSVLTIRIPGLGHSFGGVEYGAYGILLCLADFIFIGQWERLATANFVLHAFSVFLWQVQVCAVLSLPFILFPPRIRLKRLSWQFYAYYPAHLAVLLVIRTLLPLR